VNVLEAARLQEGLMSLGMPVDDSWARTRPVPWTVDGTAPARATRPRPLALPDFISRLKEAGDPQTNPARVEELLASWRPSLDSLRPWIVFDPVRYARQRLYRDEALELLLLCWDRGQSTPVHDHDGQAGWITVLEGSLGVQEYERYGGPADLANLTSDEPTPPDTVPIVPVRRLTVTAGSSVAEAAAPETIHHVGANGGRALSLHLYAGPLRSFLVFSPERGTARRVRP
jgi:cysteine dioxygenase